MTSKEEQVMNSLDKAFGLVLNEMHKILSELWCSFKYILHFERKQGGVI